MKFDVAIIGAGAAGYFTAINVKIQNPASRVVVLEKTSKTLSKVKISGGGRCNVTHNQLNPSLLAANYPRGEKFLKQVFKYFHVEHSIKWFENQGVSLNIEADGRMFPKSNSSETIIALFESLAMKLGIEVWIRSNVVEIAEFESGFHTLYIQDNQPIQAKFVVLAAGGQNRTESSDLLVNFNLKIIPSVPSLFTFNIPNQNLKEFAGLSVKNGRVKITGMKKSYTGPILITHWGLSGPAILKTSAWYARELAELNYNFTVLISWIGDLTEDQSVKEFSQILLEFPKKMLHNLTVFDIPNRLWMYVLEKSNVDGSKKCLDLKKSEINKILENLIRMPFDVMGKTTFKEEFVTAGGIDLSEINPDSMQLKNYPTIYGVGEMLDVDGITGGFNFQAAWSTAWVASQSISQNQIH